MFPEILALCQADDSHSVYVAQNPEGEILGYCAVHWLPYLLFSGSGRICL